MRLPVVPRAAGLVLAALLAALPAAAQEAPEDGAALDPLLAEELELDAEVDARDPWEEMNRSTFSFNRGVDRWVLDPITDVYQLLVPEPGRRALHRAVQNLDAPVVFVNQLLQLRFRAAGVTLGRFVVNSTAGVAGLFDAAEDGADLARIEADFGQTLGRWGTPSGPYLMIPLFGPSTVRDAVGLVVDAAGDPLTYLIGPFQWWTLALGTGEGLVVREAHAGDLRALEEGSLDFYAALRSAYLQSREARLRAARCGAPACLGGRDEGAGADIAGAPGPVRRSPTSPRPRLERRASDRR